MEYVQFGRTGIRVSRIGFGGAVAGLRNYISAYDPDTEESRKQIHKALETALEQGINYFDTAPAYGAGISESMFGDVLGDVDPNTLFLATKCVPTDYDGVMRSVEESLKRLRRDWVDLLQIHGGSYTQERADAILAPHGMLEAMEQLKKDGVVRNIGFTSEDNNDVLYEFINCGRFDEVQMCYNLIFQHPCEPSRPFGSLYEAKQKGLGVATMRATTSGTFQKWMRMIRPDDNYDYNRALIQFVLSNPLVDVVLIGMRSAARVMQNIEIINDTAGRIDLKVLHKRGV